MPLVCESCLFDLGVGSPDAHPDAEMAYAACLDAEKNAPREGNFGAGAGATVGKLGGPARMMKSGQGFYAVRLGELKVGAVAAVNALGDVFDPDSGRKLAGLLAPDKSAFADSEEALYADYSSKQNFFTGNTTLGCVVTNGKFGKAQMAKIAAMAQNGYARAIRRCTRPPTGTASTPSRSGRSTRTSTWWARWPRASWRAPSPRRAGRRARLRASGRARLYALKAFIPAKPKRPWVGKRPGVPWSAGPFCGRRPCFRRIFSLPLLFCRRKRTRILSD